MDRVTLLLLVLCTLSFSGCGKPSVEKVCEKHDEEDVEDCIDEREEQLERCDDEEDVLECAMEAGSARHAWRCFDDCERDVTVDDVCEKFADRDEVEECVEELGEAMEDCADEDGFLSCAIDAEDQDRAEGCFQLCVE